MATRARAKRCLEGDTLYRLTLKMGYWGSLCVWFSQIIPCFGFENYVSMEHRVVLDIGAESGVSMLHRC